MLSLVREHLGSFFAKQSFQSGFACLRTTYIFYWLLHIHIGTIHQQTWNLSPFQHLLCKDSNLSICGFYTPSLFLLMYLPELLFQGASVHSTSRCSSPFSSLYKILRCPMSIGSLFCRLNNEAMFPCPLMRNLDQMLVHNISFKLAKARSPVLLLVVLFIQAVER